MAERGSLNGADEPHRVALTCYEVLRAAGDGRAPAVLDSAYRELHVRATRIPDAAARRRYLEQVPHHRDVLAAWYAAQAASGP